MLIAFALALSVLIAGHEWGHYRMAVACGVRVQRFSVGFGPIIARFKPRRQHPGQDTEFVISAIPLGGYVKMLDEREGEVAPEDLHAAFNTQALWRRSLIVAAGPAANLLIAVLLYAMVSWIGVEEPRAIVAAPVAGSLAEQAGLQGGQEVLRGGLAEAEPRPVESFETLRWLLMRGALDGRDVILEVVPPDSGVAPRTVRLPLASLERREPDQNLYRDIGIVSPLTRAVLGDLMPGGAAQRDGLQPGDVVLSVGDTAVADSQQLRELIRAAGRAGEPDPERWEIDRDGARLQLLVQPDRVMDGDQPVGRIGAVVGGAAEMTLVRRGPVAGLWSGVTRTWDISVLSLRLLGRMVVGQVSLKNLSGPVLIADYASKSIQLGWTYYLGFLAFISVSLGVLNLLPIPVLDGGHLMYYLWEAVTGRAVSGAWLQHLQQAGMVFLLAVMVLAVYNDVARLLG